MSLATRNPEEHFHPLEIIPVFRRWPRSALRDFLYTGIWSSLFGLGFYLLDAMANGRLNGFLELGVYLFVSSVIGYIIHGLYWIGEQAGLEAACRAGGFFPKVLYFAAIPIAGVILGMLASSLVLGLPSINWVKRPGSLFSLMLVSLMISLVLSVIFFWRERAAKAEAAIARERARAESVERQAALANLRALQAQIEPHFLFNTLANVASLIDPDPATAKRMLDSFIRFLRASLAATRREQTTLGEEGELIGAYLDILQVRMGERLRYRVAIPPELGATTIAPMLLQPIVENAIRHGLEPKVDGGEVSFTAKRDGGDVVVEIADTGVGFAAVTEGGVGLENLRSRLQLLYPGRGRLAIVDNAPQGALVRVTVPA
jgi:sensor histidine kinase YesM